RADRVDQLPLAHFRSARNAGSLCNLIQLLAVSALERVSGLAAALAPEPGLFLQPPARACGQLCDRALLGRGLLGAFHVPASRLNLAGAHHDGPPRFADTVSSRLPLVARWQCGWSANLKACELTSTE